MCTYAHLYCCTAHTATGNTYALTATYGGIDSKQFDMIYAVYHVGGNTGDENASWQQSDVKGECLARLSKNSFPQEVTAVAAACTRFFEVCVCTICWY
jgi:hypothetical protein